MTLTLPIYYTQEFKTKASKTSLVGMNLYRNAHFFLQNNLKKHFTTLVSEQLPEISTKIGKFTVEYYLYYKSPVCDGSNIIALIEKFLLDALQENNGIENDNVNYHTGSTWTVVSQDKENPRVEIKIILKE